MSSLVRHFSRLPAASDGTCLALIRIALIAAAVAILALGLWHLPAFATSHGELIIGLVLSLAVAVQMVVAALFFPLGCRR
jgi:hypothetical protein